jgi:hypothetical protein
MKITRSQVIFAVVAIWTLMLCPLSILPGANAKGAKLLVSWKNPDYSGQKPHRILVIGMSENPEVSPHGALAQAKSGAK